MAGGVDLWSVDFASAAGGWLLCTSQPASDLQPKALFATADGGATWHLQSETCVFAASGQVAAAVGNLPC